MAYPGDFVAANRAARTDAQRAAIRRVSDLHRVCFRVREWLAKRIPPGIYSRPHWLLAIASEAQAGSTSRESFAMIVHDSPSLLEALPGPSG